MASTLDQFIVFGSDIFALERVMRLIQALGLIFTSYTRLIALAQPSRSAAAHLATRLALVSLQDWLNVTRRSLRTFWFLRSFQGSYALYADRSAKGVEDWLDVLAGSLLGVFGLLETATLPDMTRIPGLAVFGEEQTGELNVQAQMFWFLGLLAMVLSAGVKVFRLFAERAVPSGADFGGDVVGEEEEKEEEREEKGSRSRNRGEKAKESMVAKRREAEKKRKKAKEEAAKKTQREISALSIKIVNDALDMVIPASICGLYDFQPGQVGIAMLLTTLITLRGHWARCGQALQ